MRLLGWAPIQSGVFVRREHLAPKTDSRDEHRGKTMGYSKKVAIIKPRRATSEEITPADTVTLSFLTSRTVRIQVSAVEAMQSVVFLMAAQQTNTVKVTGSLNSRLNSLIKFSESGETF